MSATIDFTTVTNSIAALTISGVTIKDVDEIASTISLGTAVLAPRPKNFISNFTVTAAEISKQKLDVNYTLTYIYYHCAISGGLGGLLEPYAAMVAKLSLILVAFCRHETLTGALDNGLPTIGFIGGVFDAAGNQYHGCEIALRITQHLEV